MEKWSDIWMLLLCNFMLILTCSWAAVEYILLWFGCKAKLSFLYLLLLCNMTLMTSNWFWLAAELLWNIFCYSFVIRKNDHFCTGCCYVTSDWWHDIDDITLILTCSWAVVESRPMTTGLTPTGPETSQNRTLSPCRVAVETPRRARTPTCPAVVTAPFLAPSSIMSVVSVASCCVCQMVVNVLTVVTAPFLAPSSIMSVVSVASCCVCQMVVNVLTVVAAPFLAPSSIMSVVSVASCCVCQMVVNVLTVVTAPFLAPSSIMSVVSVASCCVCQMVVNVLTVVTAPFLAPSSIMSVVSVASCCVCQMVVNVLTVVTAPFLAPSSIMSVVSVASCCVCQMVFWLLMSQQS